MLLGSARGARDLDERVRAVTLAGSDVAGSKVAAEAGKHIKKAVMELGGSDPFIVLPSADLDVAVTTAITARNINNGQSCIAAKRFIVHERVYDEFERRMVEGLARLKVGDPMRECRRGPARDEADPRDRRAPGRWSVRSGAPPSHRQPAPRASGNFYPRCPALARIPEHAPAYREVFGPVALLWSARSVRGDRAGQRQPLRPGLERVDERRSGAPALDRRAGSRLHIHQCHGGLGPETALRRREAFRYGRELARHGIREFVNVKSVSVTERAAGRGSDTGKRMNAAELLVRCLESEGVEYVFGIPGEETSTSWTRLREAASFVATRHEQGAAFMADVYGRLTAAPVCASPPWGRAPRHAGVADANMDRARSSRSPGRRDDAHAQGEPPGAGSLGAVHSPVQHAKVLEPEIVPEVVRKAFKVAQAEKPGASFIELPENIARMRRGRAAQGAGAGDCARAAGKVEQVARLIDASRAPGAGGQRRHPPARFEAVVAFIAAQAGG